jgi:hypothetical protein
MMTKRIAVSLHTGVVREKHLDNNARGAAQQAALPFDHHLRTLRSRIALKPAGGSIPHLQAA